MNQDRNDTISISDVYSIITQLTIHSASNNWNRFNNYLIANSFLILSWATLFEVANRSFLARIALWLICVIGIIGGIFWYFLGTRGKNMLKEFVAMGSNLEDAFGDTEYKPFKKNEEIRDEAFPCLWGRFYKWSGEYYLLRWGPIVIVVLYLSLFILSYLI